MSPALLYNDLLSSKSPMNWILIQLREAQLVFYSGRHRDDAAPLTTTSSMTNGESCRYIEFRPPSHPCCHPPALFRVPGDAHDRLRAFLKKPLRAIWLNPETRLVEGMIPACSTADLSFTPVICVSASKASEKNPDGYSIAVLP